MGRKNKRKKTGYQDRLGFNPWKYKALCGDEHNMLYAEYKNYAEKIL